MSNLGRSVLKRYCFPQSHQLNNLRTVNFAYIIIYHPVCVDADTTYTYVCNLPTQHILRLVQRL